MSESPACRCIYQHALHFTALLILIYPFGLEGLSRRLWKLKYYPSIRLKSAPCLPPPTRLSTLLTSYFLYFPFPYCSRSYLHYSTHHFPSVLQFLMSVSFKPRKQPFLAVLLHPHTLACGSRNTKSWSTVNQWNYWNLNYQFLISHIRIILVIYMIWQICSPCCVLQESNVLSTWPVDVDST